MDDSFGINPNQQPPSPHPGSPYAHHNFHPPQPAPQQPLMPPPPPQIVSSAPAADNSVSGGVQPMPVVKVLSTRGVEYAMMTFALWFAADALTAILLVIINGGSSFAVLAFPVSVLIVTLPVFAWLFLRLKKAELLKPALRLDPSKRRFSQITQIFTFLVSLLAVVGLVYSIVAKIGGSYNGSYIKTLGNIVVILVIAGGIFWYYWVDEHKQNFS